MLSRLFALGAWAPFALACGARSQLLAPDWPTDATVSTDATRDVAPERDVAPPDVLRGCGSDEQCSDGIDCTVDLCDTATRVCLPSRTDDTRCPISHRCDRAMGCIAQALAHGRTALGPGLYEMHPPLGSVATLARLPVGLTDIALAPDRTLYAVATDQLYRIDANTGEGTVIVNITADFTALDAAPDGTLIAGAGSELYVLDPHTGAANVVARFPVGYEASGDLAFLSGRLLATARTSPTALDVLVEFSLSAGTARVLGPVGSSCVYGLAAFGATLYGFTCNGEVLRIDPITGHGTLLQRTGVTFFGATAR